MRGDGDGWSVGPSGARTWGRHGAAGLLLRAPGARRDSAVLLQHRALWSHHGGTWGLPGGARDSHESPVQAALREADEETGVAASDVTVRAELVTAGAPPGWSYTTVVADAGAPLDVRGNGESAELRWVPERDVTGLPLHPGLADSWPRLQATETALLVDTANVVGSRPDGWWRDRVGATERVLSRLAALAPRTVALPDGTFGWVRQVDAVVEGTARAAQVPDGPGLVVHRAPGSGDDELVRVACELGRHPDGRCLVVTADRGLRARLPAAAFSVGPATLFGMMAP